MPIFISLPLNNKVTCIVVKRLFFFLLLYWALFSYAWCPSVFEGLRFKFSAWALQRFWSLAQPMALSREPVPVNVVLPPVLPGFAETRELLEGHATQHVPWVLWCLMLMWC